MNLLKPSSIFSALLLVPTLLFAQVPERLLIKGEPAVKLSRAAQVLVDAETKSNMVVTRSNAPFRVEHIEIPLSLLGELRAQELDPKIRESMVFKKDGVDMVRWVLNPEDTKFGPELEAKLKLKGVDTTRKNYFIGYLTASRSCVIQDPVTKTTFSIKSSTNITGGNWKDKKMEVNEAIETAAMNEYLMKNFNTKDNSALRLVSEPLGFTFADADQSISIRQYDHFNSDNGHSLIPLFSVLHEKRGADIAKKLNKDPQAFWAHAAIERTAIALAELGLNYGLIPDSAHGQNFLIELNAKGEPTGKIFVRDFVDSYLVQPLVEAQGGQKIVDLYKKNEEPAYLTKTKVFSYFGPFHGSQPPTWVKDLKAYQNRFLLSYSSTAERLLSGQKLNPVEKGTFGLIGNWQGGGNILSYYTAQKSMVGDARFEKLISARKALADSRAKTCATVFNKAI